MGVKIKKEEKQSNIEQIITFKKDDLIVVEGTAKNPFFSGKQKPMLKFQGEKLEKQGLVKIVKGVQLEEVVDENRTVKEIKDK